MTRHTGEVDVYHLGRFAMLGSRHNVQHWGCSAKQARISSAIYRRVFYYLSTDERTGDLLAELAQVEQAFAHLDPNRKVRGDDYRPNADVVSIGLGTDWSALASAWLTAWERVGDPVARDRARDRLVATMEGIARLPRGFLTGEARMRLDTCRFDSFPDRIQVSHLSAVFGLGLLRTRPPHRGDAGGGAGIRRRLGAVLPAVPLDPRGAEGGGGGGTHRNLPGPGAQPAVGLGRPPARRRGTRPTGLGDSFFSGTDRLNSNPVQRQQEWEVQSVTGPGVLRPVTEAPWVSTNDAAQFGLAVIENLALIPASLPARPASPRSGQ